MPAPVDDPDWATDGGARIEPDPADVDSGFVAGTRTPARVINWVLGVLTDWKSWLRDETTRLSAYCTDTGVTLPATQQITRYLTSPVFVPTAPANWSTDGSFWQSGADAARIHCDLTHRLPKNGSIVRVRVLVDPGAARSGAARMGITLYRVNYGISIGSPALTFTSEGVAYQAASGHALQWITIDLSGAPETVGSDGWTLEVFAGQDTPSGHSSDLVYAVSVEHQCTTIRND
jgi:hypothetical protein